MLLHQTKIPGLLKPNPVLWTQKAGNQSIKTGYHLSIVRKTDLKIKFLFQIIQIFAN